MQRDVAAQKLAMEKQSATAVEAKIDEKVTEELKKVAPSNPPVQPTQAVQPDKKDEDGGLTSRSGEASRVGQ